MATETDKVAKLIKLLELANGDYITAEDAAKLFTALSEVVISVRQELINKTNSNRDSMSTILQEGLSQMETLDARLQALIRGAKQGAQDDLGLYKKEVAGQLQTIKALIPKFPDLPDFQAMLDAIKIPTIEDILNDLPRLGLRVRDSLELLLGEERLDASAIKNLPEATKEIIMSQGAHTALWALMDVAVAGIVAGQSIQWDGVKWVPYTPAGSGGTPVWAEDLTPQGPGTTFTLANTPIVGSVRLFRGGSYQSVTNSDYSISGAIITLSTTLQTGEVLVADYSH